VDKNTTNRTRQGRRGYPVLLVLLGGLALAAVGWLGVEFWAESIDSNSAQQPGAVQTQSPEPRPESPAPADSTP